MRFLSLIGRDSREESFVVIECLAISEMNCVQQIDVMKEEGKCAL